MLMEAGYDISFLWVANDNRTREQVELTKKYWNDKLTIFKLTLVHRLIVAIYRRTRFRRTGNFKVDDFYPFGLSKALLNILKNEHYDCILVNYIFLSKIFKYTGSAKKIIFTHDVFTNRFHETGNPWFSVPAEEEAKALDRADIVLGIQDSESEYYRTLTSRKVLTVYSHFRIHETPFVGKKVLLFLGGSNMHNVKAVTFFIESVFHHLISAHPELKLLVGGSVCTVLNDSIKKQDSIEIIGEVNELLQFYSLGDIVINPTAFGTGLKIKTFEAMAYGKVSIAHPHNTIGIFKKEEAPILEAVSPGDYIKHIDFLLNNKDQVLRIKYESVKYIMDLNNIVHSRFIQAIEETD